MTYGAEIWGPILASAATTAGASYLSGEGSRTKETKLQKIQRKMIDELIASLSGEGRFADLFSKDDEAFQKSFVEPAQAMFQNQIAPQIQQQYIAGGQQRGTGLDDTLTRAGIDMDAMLNQYLYQHQQDAMNRKSNLINSILGVKGEPYQPSAGQNVMSGLGGYVGSEGFNKRIDTAFEKYGPQRKGFEGGSNG